MRENVESQSRTVVFVTYQFPPTGGGGVQRLAKFARYLPSNGWQATVVSAKHVRGREFDETLVRDVADVPVLRTPARPINVWVSRSLERLRGVRDRVLRRGVGAGQSHDVRSSVEFAARVASTGRAGRTEQITRFIAIPDAAALWIGPAVRAGVKLARQSGADAILASGPPFSVLIAGTRIARKTGLPLILDYRDAWRDNPGYVWYPTEWHRRRAIALERKVLSQATAVTMAHPIADEIRDLGGPEPVLVPNGFDRSDLPSWEPDSDGPLVVAFMGAFYSSRDPLPFFEALKSAREGQDGNPRDIRLRIIGRWPDYIEGVITGLGLDSAVELHPYMPHAEALDMVARSDVGLSVLADLPCVHGTPAKVYEYMGIGLPVLFVGPMQGHAQDLIREADAGLIVPYTDTNAIASALGRLATAKAEGSTVNTPHHEVISRYERCAQAAQMARVLDSALGH